MWKLLVVLLLLVSVTTCHSWGSSKDKILLKDVEVITLYDGRKTMGRRSNPVPQLTLKGGSAANRVGPLETVQCYNRGHDGYDVQWECVANLPTGVRFGHINVNCEGYDYPDDPYVLKGSCGLEYTLESTGGHNSNSYYSGNQKKSYYNSYNKSESSFSTLFLLIAVGGAIYIVYKSCLAPTRTTRPAPPTYEQTVNSERPRRNRLYPDIPPPSYPGREPTAPPSGNDPPPAYGWAPEYTSQSGSGTSTYSGSRTHTIFDTPNQSQTNTGTNTNTNQSGSGFWSGMAAGGVLGYLFGNRGRGNYYHHQPHYGYHRPQNSWWNWNSGPGYSSSWGNSSGGGWFSGGNSWGSSRPSGGYRSGGDGGVSRSSGFGGTSRR